MEEILTSGASPVRSDDNYNNEHFPDSTLEQTETNISQTTESEKDEALPALTEVLGQQVRGGTLCSAPALLFTAATGHSAREQQLAEPSPYELLEIQFSKDISENIIVRTNACAQKNYLQNCNTYKLVTN
ncbi:unnamed protein product [Dicrocoelium dendriticum]|nr:unnamed protein product [Dicrocoelium dendriticum]